MKFKCLKGFEPLLTEPKSVALPLCYRHFSPFFERFYSVNFIIVYPFPLYLSFFDFFTIHILLKKLIKSSNESDSASNRFADTSFTFIVSGILYINL